MFPILLWIGFRHTDACPPREHWEKYDQYFFNASSLIIQTHFIRYVGIPNSYFILDNLIGIMYQDTVLLKHSNSMRNFCPDIKVHPFRKKSSRTSDLYTQLISLFTIIHYSLVTIHYSSNPPDYTLLDWMNSKWLTSCTAVNRPEDYANGPLPTTLMDQSNMLLTDHYTTYTQQNRPSTLG